MFRLVRNALVAAALLHPVGPAGAQDYAIEGVASLEILPGYRTPQGTHMAAARIRLKEGWKTYWRATGGNGIPPRFDWTGSRNIAGVAVHWPAPSLLEVNGVRIIGYKNQLVLPLEFKLKDGSRPIFLSGSVDFGVCQDVCLPARAEFTTVLPADQTSHRAVIQAALNARPLSAVRGGVKSVRCGITPIKDGFHITADIRLSENPGAATLAVIEFPHPEVWVEQDRTVVLGTTLTATANLYAFTQDPLVLDRSKVRVTLLGESRTVDIIPPSGMPDSRWGFPSGPISDSMW